MWSLRGTAPAFVGTMTIANFKARIYGYINRSATIFTTTEGASIDQVTYAMNDAILAAQREYSFELNRTDAFLTTSEFGANWVTGCKTTPGGSTALVMRRIDTAWNFTTNPTTPGNVYARTSRIQIGTANEFRRLVPEDEGTLTLTTTSLSVSRKKFIYMNGPLLRVTTISTATPVLLNGIQMIQAVTDDDIFLTYFSDWLHWATLIQLNQFLKASERINIDLTFVNRLWQSVKEMDGQMANSGDIATLS